MCDMLLVISAIVIFIIIIGIYQKSTNAVCLSRRRLDGKTVIVTGGTAGIGFEIATDLAHRGARVIIACPFEHDGTNARKQIIEDTKNNNVVFKILDLGSLKSTRQFAADILKTEDRLDVLINNAGVGVPGDFVTSDGMNFIMQVNYYGTFLLTLLLLPLLAKTGTPSEPSRILLTTSVLHRFGQVDIKNLNKTNQKPWFRLQIYANSKLCLLLFANELSKKLKKSNVVINNVDPGAVGTAIFESGSKSIGIFIKMFVSNTFKTPRQGAQTALHVVLDKNAGNTSAAFYQNCRMSKAAPRAYSEKTAKILWEDSVRLVQITEDELAQCFEC